MAPPASSGAAPPPALRRRSAPRSRPRIRGEGRHGAAAWLVLLALCCLSAGLVPALAASPAPDRLAFPPALDSYGDADLPGVWEVLRHRVSVQPLNLWASLLFLGALVHTFFTHRFLVWAHRIEERHAARHGAPRADGMRPPAARVLHFFGEVEAVFGIWCLPLFVLLAAGAGWDAAVAYFNHGVSYIEPTFVVVIMAIASTRPILEVAERALGFVARLGGGGVAAWWLAILTLGPVLGSLITEPAAMTIAALLLARQFYACRPSLRCAYATLGLLFVNISVGGVFTHFAAPPVLMVAGAWGWTTPFMLRHFGLMAFVGIVVANALYFLAFRKELARLTPSPDAGQAATGPAGRRVPSWVSIAHAAFMGWAVLSAHSPALLVGGFLFFLAFYEVTLDHQGELQLRTPILVGFFLAGLVVHGGLQSWWIGPVLGRLTETPLMLGAIVLTAFNDNAAITYLATLVPDLTDALKQAVVAGAVTGGGLTVIANAPNPAGQAILGRYFPGGVAPLGLLLGALPATVILALCFLFL